MTIEEKLKNLPSDPGVYLMFDDRGEVIYVGKAKVLKNRVRQYFHGGKKDERVQALVKLISDLNYIITLSEKDAFALESSLVKKYYPKFNILLKDDKGAPYIRINLKEEFPSMQVVRKVKRDGARYFGPYFNGVRVMDIVAIVRAAYRVRFCKGRFGKRECLNFHINLCLGPCHMLKRKRTENSRGDNILNDMICKNNAISVTHNVSKAMDSVTYNDEYRMAVDRAVAFLSGRDDEARGVIEERMRRAADAEDFERAISYREQLGMIEKMKERHIVSFASLEDVDSFYLAADGINSAVAVNVVRGGRMMGVRVFYLGQAMGDLSSFITQYYDGNEIPKKVNVGIEDGAGEAEFDGLEDYLGVLKGVKVTVNVPERGGMRMLVDMTKKNAVEHLNSGADKHKREYDMTVGAMERLGKLLGIEGLRRIECYDVSNTAGEDVVASGVVFTDGKPDKSNYRRYKIRTVDGQDDYAAISEVMQRRFKDGAENVPDLVVIDGGKGQLTAAWSVVRNRILSNGQILSHMTSKNVISLAKKDEVIYRIDDEPLSLAKGDYALRLLIRLRDEAHRFANSYNRILRGGKLGSLLEQIDGVGEAKRKKILANISFKEIKLLSADEIANRAGIDKRTAENISEYFKG